MNKSKGNMYEFVTHTWNPLAGECPHKCSYCSTKKMLRYPAIAEKYSGSVRIDPVAIEYNHGKNRFIFVCAQNDLFAADVPENCIMEILNRCRRAEKNNKYLFQTKNPERFLQFKHLLPEHTVFCTTIESNRDSEVAPAACSESWRHVHAAKIAETMTTYLTVEPVMEFDALEFAGQLNDVGAAQINIGADSGGNNLPEPTKKDIEHLISQLNTKIVLKPNLSRIVGDLEEFKKEVGL